MIPAANEPDGRPDAKSTKRRVATRELVTIGQRWKRRSSGTVFVIRQVHRADRRVVMEQTGSTDAVGQRFQVGFRDLRAKYVLDQPDQGDQQPQ